MSTIDPSTTTSFDYKRSPVSGRLLGGALFAAFGLWIILQPGGVAGALSFNLGLEPVTAARLLGVAVAIIGAGGLASWGLLRGMEGDALRLSPAGLSVGAGQARIEEVPWEEVTGAEIVTVGGTEMLGVLVSNPERLFSRRDVRTRERAARVTREHGTPVLVPGSLLAARLTEVAAAIEAYREAHGVGQAS